MTRLFVYIIWSFSLCMLAQNADHELHPDSVIVDTLIVSDTIITYDTIYVKKARLDLVDRDTLFLATDSDSWSVIEEEVLDLTKFQIRQDSGMMLLTSKISFSDNYDLSSMPGYTVQTIPPLAFQVEYFHNNFFSYGGQLLYGRNKFVNDTLSSQFEKGATMGIAALGTFHYGAWLQDVTNHRLHFDYLDLYMSLAFRMDLHRQVLVAPWDESEQAFAAGQKDKDLDLRPRIGLIFGARYYISDRISINIEAGKGNLGVLTSSVSWLISKPY